MTGDLTSGREAHQITLRPFPFTDTKYQIASGSGSVDADRHLLDWSPDGRRVFYWESENRESRIIAVEVQLRPAFTLGKSAILPFQPIRGDDFDVAPDGEHFLAMAPRREPVTQLNVVLNWFKELNQRVPAR